MMGKFKILYESERVFKGYREYRNKKFKEYYKRFGKRFSKVDLNYRKNMLKSYEEKIKEEWFNIVFKLTKEGKFIDKKTLTDVYNLDGFGGYLYRLKKYNPEGDFDQKFDIGYHYG